MLLVLGLIFVWLGGFLVGYGLGYETKIKHLQPVKLKPSNLFPPRDPK